MPNLKKKLKKTSPVAKFKKDYFVVFDSIFHQKIHVFINWTIPQYNKWLAKMGIESKIEDSYLDRVGGFSSILTRKGYQDEYIIFMPRFDNSLSEVSTLLHEIVHTVIKLWNSNNISYGYETQEFFAWTIGNVFYSIAQRFYKG